MKTLVWINSFLILVVSTHVSIEHGGTHSVFSNHEHTHSSHEHSVSDYHIAFEDAHGHEHESFNHSHPEYLRIHSQYHLSINGIQAFVFVQTDRLNLSPRFLKDTNVSNLNLPPPKVVPIYTTNQSLLI